MCDDETGLSPPATMDLALVEGRLGLIVGVSSSAIELIRSRTPVMEEAPSSSSVGKVPDFLRVVRVFGFESSGPSWSTTVLRCRFLERSSRGHPSGAVGSNDQYVPRSVVAPGSTSLALTAGMRAFWNEGPSESTFLTVFFHPLPAYENHGHRPSSAS